MITGMNGGTGVAVSIPISGPRKPPSATSATTPYAAPIDSRFITPALSAPTGAERGQQQQERQPDDPPMNSGSRLGGRLALVDERRGRAADEHVRAAARQRVVAVTRSSVAASCGEVSAHRQQPRCRRRVEPARATEATPGSAAHLVDSGPRDAVAGRPPAPACSGPAAPGAEALRDQVVGLAGDRVAASLPASGKPSRSPVPARPARAARRRRPARRPTGGAGPRGSSARPASATRRPARGRCPGCAAVDRARGRSRAAPAAASPTRP